MTVLRLFLCFLAFACCFSGNTAAAEPTNSTAWIGFPIITLDGLPNPIDLTQPQTLGSAFLLQLRRQAVLIAARDELGATTRDAFFEGTAPEHAVRIPDVAEFPNAAPQYTDHLQFLIDVEKLSRNEFVAEWESLGIQRAEPSPQGDTDLESEHEEIATLIGTWALIPQFEAVRRTHEAIRQHGETLLLLEHLVRGYSHLQILTNNHPLDTHRVFQARAMLYAQRAVAQYGETPETLSLRAAAWSLNNFHRLAREGFATIPVADIENAEPWIKLAQLYADFDIRGLADAVNAAEFAQEKGLASLLHFMLLDYSQNGRLARQFGEKAIADLPDCARFFQGVYATSIFNMIHAPDGSPFHEHLARRIAPALQEMRGLPDDVSETVRSLSAAVNPPVPAGGLLGRLFGGQATPQSFPTQEFFINLATVLQALSATTPENDRHEPSLQALATLIQDEQFVTVRVIGRGLRGRNIAPERIIEPATPALETHPAFDFLALAYRDQALLSPIRMRLLERGNIIPHNLFSMTSPGIRDQRYEENRQVQYSPPYIACLFADLENIRDVTLYHDQASRNLFGVQHYFLVDIFRQLAPNNPHTIAIRMARDHTLTHEEIETFKNEFGEYPVVRNLLLWYFERHGLLDVHLEFFLADFEAQPTRDLSRRLMHAYLNRNKPDKAIDILIQYMASPDARRALNYAGASADIGRILLSQGRIQEAESYIVTAGQTFSSWGLDLLAQYYAITGQFTEAERVYRAAERTYPETGPFRRWALHYATNHPDLDQLSTEVLQHSLTQARTAHATDSFLRATTVSHCMDTPFLPELGRHPFFTHFHQASSGLVGIMQWFDFKEKNQHGHAEEMLRRVRGLLFLGDVNVAYETPPQVFPVMPRQVYVFEAYRRLAALFEVDLRTQNPGNLDPAEVEFLIRSEFTNDLNTGAIPGTLYILGRYYKMHGQNEKAIECFRRLLAIPTVFDRVTRSYAIKELRELMDFTADDLIRFSQSDPQLPRFRISNTPMDVLVRQHFRVYTESPSATVLARPVAAEPVAMQDFSETSDWTSGLYKVMNVQFRGEGIQPEESSVFWAVPRDDRSDWVTHGIATAGSFLTQVLSRRPDGSYPLRLGRHDPVHALASFHGHYLILVLSLDPDKEPIDVRPTPESNFVRIVLKKAAELPSNEVSPRGSVSPNFGQNVRTDNTATMASNDDETLEWIDHARFAAILVTGIALVLAIVLAVTRKRRKQNGGSLQREENGSAA